MDNIVINYLAPFLIVNGLTNYVFQNKTKKTIINNFSLDKPKETLKEVPSNITIPEVLEKCTNILKYNLSKECLDNLYRNISNVEINKKIMLYLRGLAGTYLTSANKITYTSNSSLSHEFIHMASAYYDQETNIIKTGFLDFSQNGTLGNAFNEGYTEMLNIKYFNPKYISYKEEINIVKFFELLFKEKELEKLYFTNDFVGLIKNLNNYMTTKDAINLLSNFDLAFKLKNSFNPAYLPIYLSIKNKLANIFINSKPSFHKQIDYLILLEENPLINTIQKTNLKLTKIKNYS